MAGLQRTVLTAVVFGFVSIGITAECLSPAVAADAHANVSKPANQAGIDRKSLTYDGKPFEHWRKQLLTELKPQLRLNSLQALIVFGGNGYADEVTEDLLRVLNGYSTADCESMASDESAAGDESAAALLQVAYMAALANAAGGQATAPPASALLPDRVAHLQIMTLAAEGLAKSGAHAIPILLRAIEDNSNPGMGRAAALSVLESVGPAAKSATIASLLRVVGNPNDDAEFIDSATKILLGLQPAADQILPILKTGAASADPKRRTWAVATIGELGGGAREALPVLKGVLSDPSVSVVLAAAAALRKVDPPARFVAPTLFQCLSKVEPKTGNLSQVIHELDEVGFFVACLGGDRKGFDVDDDALHDIALVGPFRDVLQGHLTQKNLYSPTAVSAVIQLLGEMGPKARAAVEPLQKIAADHSAGNTHAAEAAQALSKITPPSEKH